MTHRLASLVLAGMLATTPLAAQLASRVEFDGSVIASRYRSTASGGAALSGVAARGEVRALAGMFSIQGWYLQGRLAPDTGVSATNDLVEAGILAAVHPRSWLAIATGPRVRAYVQPSGTERWVFWEGSARAEGDLFGSVRAYVELWAGLGGSVTPGQQGSGARGGEAGVTVRFAHSPLWGRLGYAIDHVGLKSGGMETLDGIALTVGFGGR